jgi:predicted S18 family serine protease
MRKIMSVLMLAVSFYSFGASAMSSGYASIMTSYAADCQGDHRCKESIRVIEDANDYFQTGNMSALLAEKVKEAQLINNSLSEMDALDELLTSSQEIVKLEK